MVGESSGERISQKAAQNIVLVMLIVSVILSKGRTFIDPDFFGALTGISSASILFWAYTNPEMLTAKKYG